MENAPVGGSSANLEAAYATSVLSEGPISPSKAHEEAVSLANAVEFGLANTIWSKNIDTALSVGRALRSGTVWINTTIDGAPQLPGGGVKNSAYGREMGQAGFDEFTEIKTIQIRTGKHEPFFRDMDNTGAG